MTEGRFLFYTASCIIGLIGVVSTEYVPKKVEIDFTEPFKTFTDEDIKEFDGSDPEKPLYMAVKGVVFDVTSGRDFYGPGSSYNALVGKDASRGVSMMSLDPKDLTHDLTGLSDSTLKSLDDIYEHTYKRKYHIVGYMEYLVTANEQADSSRNEL